MECRRKKFRQVFRRSAFREDLSVTVTPLGDKAGNYLSNTASATITANRSFGFNIAAQLKRTVTITVPKGAELTGKLTNSFSYSVLNPAASPVTDESEGTDTYTYIYANGTTYYYKVSMEGAVTYWVGFGKRGQFIYRYR